MPQVTRQDGHGPPHSTRYSLGALPAGPSATGHELEIASICGAMVIGSTVIGSMFFASVVIHAGRRHGWPSGHSFPQSARVMRPRDIQ